MRTSLLMAVLLLSSAASAQVQFRFGTAKTDTLRFGKNNCEGAVTVTWTRTVQPCAALTLFLTNQGSCPTAINTSQGDVSLSEVPLTSFQTSTTGTFTFNTSVLPYGSTSDGGASGCGTLADEKTFLLCGTTRQVEGYLGACGSTVVSATAGKVIYDGKPPVAPTLSSVVGLDSAVLVNLSAPTDAVKGVVRMFLGDAEVRRATWTVGQGSVQIDELQNDTTYQIDALVYDDAGNESPASARVDVTPIKTYGYLELYRLNGGQETGGCGATGGGVLGGAVLAALGFWLFSRRNRSWLEQ